MCLIKQKNYQLNTLWLTNNFKNIKMSKKHRYDLVSITSVQKKYLHLKFNLYAQIHFKQITNF